MPGLDDGAVPAIADIDLDGRNELVVTSAFWDGWAGYYDKVWVYDFAGTTPHGSVLWGQFMANASHHGFYGPAVSSPVTPPGPGVQVTVGGTGTGTVTSTPVGIDCGSDCEMGIFLAQVAFDLSRVNAALREFIIEQDTCASAAWPVDVEHVFTGKGI